MYIELEGLSTSVRTYMHFYISDHLIKNVSHSHARSPTRKGKRHIQINPYLKKKIILSRLYVEYRELYLSPHLMYAIHRILFYLKKKKKNLIKHTHPLFEED